MGTLKTFAAFLKEEKLKAYTLESLVLVRTMDIPLMKLFSHLSEADLLKLSLAGNEAFFNSLIEGTALDIAKRNLSQWEADKLPGISRYDIQPSDLVLIYALQKKMMIRYLPEYSANVTEVVVIITELEDYYTTVQDGAVKMFFKIQKETEQRLKESEDTLKATSLELKRSNAELEQFAYVASHDLQEPLRMVNSYIQLLSNRYKDKLDEDANDFINFAIDGSNRMRNLINSLLEYSRINRVKPFQLTNIQDIVEDVLTDLEKSITLNSARIYCGEMPSLWVDPVLIGQLFLNLISNAIKFKEKRKPEIHLTCEKKGGKYVFLVRDNGIGIKKEYFKKIFVIFQRLHSNNEYPGTGIGLAVCKKIVERHGGEIWVESEPGT